MQHQRKRLIGEYSVSIKPATFKEKIGIAEIRPNGDVVVYYEKKGNEIVISEIEELTDKGKELVRKIKKVLKPSLEDFY